MATLGCGNGAVFQLVPQRFPRRLRALARFCEHNQPLGGGLRVRTAEYRDAALAHALNIADRLLEIAEQNGETVDSVAYIHEEGAFGTSVFEAFQEQAETDGIEVVKEFVAGFPPEATEGRTGIGDAIHVPALS